MSKTMHIRQAIKHFVLCFMITAIAVFAFAGVTTAGTDTAVEIHQQTHENEAAQQEKGSENDNKDDKPAGKNEVPGCH